MSALVKITPEGLDVANSYLTTNSIEQTAAALCVSTEKVTEVLNTPEVKRYIDTVYLDLGYRNKFKLGSLLDEIIESKLEEARESEMFTSKDLLDVLQFAHKMRMEEIKALQLQQNTTIKNQTNVQINEGTPFGQGNYGKLMEKLLSDGGG
jgi:hypothetical protein